MLSRNLAPSKRHILGLMWQNKRAKSDTKGELACQSTREPERKGKREAARAQGRLKSGGATRERERERAQDGWQVGRQAVSTVLGSYTTRPTLIGAGSTKAEDARTSL